MTTTNGTNVTTTDTVHPIHYDVRDYARSNYGNHKGLRLLEKYADLEDAIIDAVDDLRQEGYNVNSTLLTVDEFTRPLILVLKRLADKYEDMDNSDW